MKKPPIAVMALVLVQTAVPAPSAACPGPPSLWDLAGQSDLIVVATVERLDLEPAGEASGADPSFRSGTAILQILDTWKGPFLREVAVTGLHCPRESCVGTIVVAFLDRSDLRIERWRASQAALRESLQSSELSRGEQAEILAQDEEGLRRFEEEATGKWLPSGLYFETRASDAAERDVRKDLVVRAVRLQEAGPVADADRREWLVSAAERRISRRDAIDELLYRGESASVVEPNGESPAAPLTDDELARLAKGFVEEPSLDDLDAAMLKLLAAYPDGDVDRRAASVVESALTRKPIGFLAVDLVEETLRRYGDSFGNRIGREERDERGRIVSVGANEDTLPGIWRQAKRELGIPDVAPAETPDAATR